MIAQMAQTMMIRAVSVRGGGLASTSETETRRWARSPLASVSICLVALMALNMCMPSQARYIHATYRFSPANYHDQQPQLAASNGMEMQPEVSRRQDYESDEADDDDLDDDQRTAASYRNQDDGGGGENGGAGDSYGDNESDGPYEETPADQEGQADLERFFDDHLGASDREGMDKENLPTNLVALLSDPPGLMNMNARHTIQLPAIKEMASAQLANKLTVVPMMPVENPTVQPFPDERMLITQRVTARNSPHRPPPRPLKLSSDTDNSLRPQSLPKTFGQSNANPAPSQLTSVNEPSVGLANNLLTSQQSFGLRISPTEALPSVGPAVSSSPVVNDVPVASPSGVVSTEDEEFDRVYVTNETNKPFKIDALGGFDPEEDFIDAAQELDGLASDKLGTRNPLATSERTGLKRRSNRNQEAAAVDDGQGTSETAPSLSDELAANRSGHSASAPLQEISFNDQDQDTDMMYEDASETDEITFGQDDPYQTDLEAEMRQQEYDKLRADPRGRTNDQLSSRGDNLNVVVDNGDSESPNRDATSAKQAAASYDSDDDDDIDSDIDSENKPDPSSSQQRDSIAAAAAIESTKNRPGRGTRSDIDDEGAWVNDGADEMEIPSQSHQNSVLEKAEQRDKAAAAARKNADEANDNQNPDGDAGAAAVEAESGQTNDNREESVRMPNADYLKNDFVEDDSGYAS